MNKLQQRDILLPVFLALLRFLQSLPASETQRCSFVRARTRQRSRCLGNGHLNFFWVSEVNATQPIPKDVQTTNGNTEYFGRYGLREIKVRLSMICHISPMPKFLPALYRRYQLKMSQLPWLKERPTRLVALHLAQT